MQGWVLRLWIAASRWSLFSDDDESEHVSLSTITQMVLMTCETDHLGCQNERKPEIMRVSSLMLNLLTVWNPGDDMCPDQGHGFQGHWFR